jgi:hypothetical protein
LLAGALWPYEQIRGRFRESLPEILHLAAIACGEPEYARVLARFSAVSTQRFRLQFAQ